MSRAVVVRVAALAVLCCEIVAFGLLWPLPALGYAADVTTGEVLAVQPDSPAARAGLRPGDVVTMIYGYPWARVNEQLVNLPLPWRIGTPTPLHIMREGHTLELEIRTGAPDLSLQVEKVLRAVLALACWSTGYLLATSPRIADPNLRRTAWFWLALSGILGLYRLTSIVSYPLTVGVLWVLSTILAPLAVAIHAWYPSRLTTAAERRGVWRGLLLAIGLLQIVALGLALTAPATTVAYQRFHELAAFVFLGSIMLSVVALFRAYQATTIAHVRRQIRLIAGACMIAASWWLLLLLVGASSPALNAAIPTGTFSLAAGLIPLSYLAGGVSADLMRLDQVFRRLVTHMLAGVGTLLVLYGCLAAGLLVGTPLLFVIFGLAIYPWVWRLTHHLVVGRSMDDVVYEPLQRAMGDLGTSLDAQVLIQRLADGVQQTFHHPPIAIYLRRDEDASTLELMLAHALAVPASVSLPPLPATQQGRAVVLPASDVQQQLQALALEATQAEVLFHPAIVLWGVIRHQRGPLLGLVLIGPRGDIDPYQPSDFAHLRQLMAAASLAFTNSASFAEQVAAQQEIRQLYQHLKQAQAETAAAIAREIHDEVLNINLRLNIETLQGLVQQTGEPHIQEQLLTVLEGERSTGQLLRLICEELQLTSIDDPLGLVASLHRLEGQVRSQWSGTVVTRVINEPVPVEQQVHQELVRIAREALTNAVKHAEATEIVVELRFPAGSDGLIELRVCDNGRSGKTIAPRPRHMGLQYMEESARAIGGTIRWGPGSAGGTVVAVSAPVGGAGAPEPVYGGTTGFRFLPNDHTSLAVGRLDSATGG